MAIEPPPYIDVEALHELAGEKAFARGKALHDQRKVTLFLVEPERVVAHVEQDFDSYRVVLQGRGRSVGSECSCKAGKATRLCAHRVAAALASNRPYQSDVPTRNLLGRIRLTFAGTAMYSLPKSITAPRALRGRPFREINDISHMTPEEQAAFERLREDVQDAWSRGHDYRGHREYREWTDGFHQMFDELNALTVGGRAGLALPLFDEALHLIADFIANNGDPGSIGSRLMDRGLGLLLDSARSAKTDPVALANALFRLDVTYGGVFDRAFLRAADLLGEEGMAEYRRLALEAWDQLPLTRAGGRDHGFLSGRDQLLSILDFFAERDGDIEGRIALRTKNLSRPYHYAELAKFCLAQGWREEALLRAKQGLRTFRDDWGINRLLRFAVELLSSEGRDAEAQRLVWQILKHRPNIDAYQMLRRVGGEPARDRVIAFVRKRIRWPTPRWSSATSFLVHVLMLEKMFEEAWQAAVKYDLEDHLLRDELAKASEKTHPSQALAVYMRKVERLLADGNARNYQQAARLITRMAALREPSEQMAYVAQLKARYSRKRSFVKLLDALPGS